MKMVTKKIPLFPISAKKDTISSDLLRSEPDSEKKVPLKAFLRILGHYVNNSKRWSPWA